MSHLLRVWKDISLVRGFVTGVEMRDLDENTFKAINGDDGGVWNPSNPIKIAGAGVAIVAEWRGNGAGFEVRTYPNKPISFEEGSEQDYFGLAVGHEGRTPNVTTTLQHALTLEPERFTAFYGTETSRFQISPTNLYPMYGLVDNVGNTRENVLANAGLYDDLIPQFACALNVYDGGVFDNVVLHFSVDHDTVVPNTLPYFLPRMRIIAVSNEGEIIPLRAEDATTDASGLVKIASPVSGTAWYNSGNVQTFTYVCNVPHTVDLSKYSYFIEIYAQYPAQNPLFVSNSFYSAVATFKDVAILNGRF